MKDKAHIGILYKGQAGVIVKFYPSQQPKLIIDFDTVSEFLPILRTVFLILLKLEDKPHLEFGNSNFRRNKLLERN